VQQPVARGSGFGCGQLSGQGEQPQPGGQVGGGQM
jgi:hypothetical protein